MCKRRMDKVKMKPFFPIGGRFCYSILTSPTGEQGYRKVQERLLQGQSRKQEAEVKSRGGLSRRELYRREVR